MVIEDRVSAGLDVYEVKLGPADGRGLAWLYENGEVLARQSRTDGSTLVTVRLGEERMTKALSRFGASLRLVTSLSEAAE